MNGIVVMKPGAFSTVQDGGRWGLQKYGVSPGGAMEMLSYRTANMLVGNAGNVPALEMTLLGPTLELRQDALVAVCGADMRPKADGRHLPMNRPVLVKAGSVVSFGASVGGSRSYLAVAGGFDVPRVLGGFGCYPAAGLEGLAGRPIREGDRLGLAAPGKGAKSFARHLAALQGSESGSFIAEGWSVAVAPSFAEDKHFHVRVLPGKRFSRLSAESQALLFERYFTVGTQSNRMGYRLKGPKLQLAEASEMVSEPVTPGTVQLPPGGDPIVLMADRQTTGGYPPVAYVISADLPLLAQAAPGDSVSFERTSLAEAERLYAEQQRKIRLLERMIALKYAEVGRENE